MPEQYIEFKDVSEVYTFLRGLGANEQLLNHLLLVAEAAEMIIEKIKRVGAQFDEDFVRLGVALHDSGKILFSVELNHKGNRHESGGQEFLLSQGVSPRLARCCLSHAQWETMECSIEEMLIALSDKLWKGKREEELEKRVINELAKIVGKNPWDLMIDLDSEFESIASQASERLLRSAGHS